MIGRIIRVSNSHKFFADEYLQDNGSSREDSPDLKESNLAKKSVKTEQQIENEGKESFYVLRTCWSRCIIVWISLLIIFNIFLTILIGFNWLNYKDYKWFVNSITFETFLQVVGLGYVAAHFLFSEKR